MCLRSDLTGSPRGVTERGARLTPGCGERRRGRLCLWSRNQGTRSHVSALSPTCWVTLGRSLPFSGPQCLLLYKGYDPACPGPLPKPQCCEGDTCLTDLPPVHREPHQQPPWHRASGCACSSCGSRRSRRSSGSACSSRPSCITCSSSSSSSSWGGRPPRPSTPPSTSSLRLLCPGRC